MSTKTAANIAMYRLNELGDCFLITFTTGAVTSRMLIDCGSFRNDKKAVDRLNEITAQIETRLNGQPLDVVVGTHQHNDHLSGFVHCKETFRKIGVREVWLSWLDDPNDHKAQRIGEDHNNLMLTLAAARKRLHASVPKGSSSRPLAARSLEVLNDVLGFHGAMAAGAPPKIPAEGVRILKTISGKNPEYLRPGRTLDMPGLPVGSVRVHVLGPPRKEGVERKDDPLYRKDPRKGESYDHALASASLQATRFLAAVQGGISDTASEEEHYPFNNQCKRRGVGGAAALRDVKRNYRRGAERWRTIDDDWLRQAEGLALYLDTFTNNSSLVFAIELVASKKVLLFAADAQAGNWASWKDVEWSSQNISTDDLLARTVFYKVGHHASHNATLVEAFEKMRNPDLVAFIPVHKRDPNITKPKGWKMPAKNLFKELMKKTENRVLQMDDANPPSCNPFKDPAKAAWKRIGIKPKVNDLSIEIDLP